MGLAVIRSTALSYKEQAFYISTCLNAVSTATLLIVGSGKGGGGVGKKSLWRTGGSEENHERLESVLSVAGLVPQPHVIRVACPTRYGDCSFVVYLTTL